MVVGTEPQSEVEDLVIDRHMLACTILYTLSGGRSANNDPLDFDDLMEVTKMGFNDPGLFDHVKAGKLELADLLQAMHLDTPLDTLLASSPFFWCVRTPCQYVIMGT
jgi:hypothetical protein